MSNQRLENWPELLNEYLAKKANEAFDWGKNDCVSFAADAYESITGKPAVAVTWSKAKPAIQTVKDLGGLGAAMCAVLGDPTEYLLTASRGDIGLLSVGDRQYAAVFDGANWLTPSADGLVSNPLDAALKVWRI